jgi:glycosyltransferase involved in cell wall biosynthesis
MRVMTAMYTIRRGGAYDRFRMMVESLLERQCEVYCLSLTPIEFQDSQYHNCILGPRLRNVDGWLGKFVVLFLFPIYALLIARKMKVDLLLAFGSLYAFILVLPKWILRRPMVAFIRGDSTFGLKIQNTPQPILWISRGLEYLGLRSCDRIITVNTAIGEQIKHALRSKQDLDVQVLFNNIPAIPDWVQKGKFAIRARYGIPAIAKVLVTAGIINRGKNIEMLIQSLPGVRRGDLYLLIVGEGSKQSDVDHLASLKDLTGRMGLSKRVFFLGWLEKEELWQVFHAGDLFVLASRSEGMPNAMLEALGCDLPCLGSNIPGVKDILQYDELLFDPSDEGGLRKRIENILSDRNCMENVKGLCHERRKEFFFDWKERAFQIAIREFGGKAEQAWSR